MHGYRTCTAHKDAFGLEALIALTFPHHDYD
jgi:hypothetical protein